MQIADGCAYAIRRYLSGLRYGEELAETLYGKDFRSMLPKTLLHGICGLPAGPAGAATLSER